MKRFYYVSDDLDDLEQVERELESAGIIKPKIHVISRDDAGVETRKLHKVQEFMRSDVVHSSIIGAMIGLVCAALVLIAAYASGIAASVGWAPFVLFAILVLGFCTWEGGLIGIHRPHYELRHMDSLVQEGQHVLFVDMEPEELPLMEQVEARHLHLQPAGEGSPTPWWAIHWQKKWHDFVRAMP